MQYSRGDLKMKNKKTYNILMYSHDTYGLGHIRRTMAIAANIREPEINIIIITGSPIAGRFTLPQQVDFIRVPGMIKKTNEEYLPLSIKINPGQAMDIRQNIIAVTAKTFKPDLLIVDKEPLGLKKEILPTLKWINKHLPDTKTVLGLRDIMDDSETVIENWKRKDIYNIIDKLYKEVWIYGNQNLYDPIKEYAIPDNIKDKIRFTGYIKRRVADKDEVIKERKINGIKAEDKLVVVTAGGGGDGYLIFKAYLAMLQSDEFNCSSFKSILITGPFMPAYKRKKILKYAGKLKIKAFYFYRDMEKLMAGADLVITMGGHNTLCELLTLKIPNLIIPRETPRQEQLIRAQRFSNNNLSDYIKWDKLTPEILYRKIIHILEHPEKQQKSISRFKMTGIDVMRSRIKSFRSNLEKVD